MGSLSDEDRDLTQADKNEGVSIFFGRRPMESVINSVVKRSNSIPNQFVEDSSSGASPGAVARKAAFFDRYIRTVSMEKTRQGDASARSSAVSDSEDAPTAAVAVYQDPNLEVGPLDESDEQVQNEASEPDKFEAAGTEPGLEKVDGYFDKPEESEQIEASLVVTEKVEESAAAEQPLLETTEDEAPNLKAVEASSGKGGTNLMIEQASTRPEQVQAKAQTKPSTRAGKVWTPSTVTAPVKTGSKSMTHIGVPRSKPAQVTVETARKSSAKRDSRSAEDTGTSNRVKREPTKTATSNANGSAGRTASNASGFNLRSKERAEKRKEFKLKMDEKHHVREAEKNKLQAKTQEETQAEIREFRKALNFRATPMPSFYQEVQPNSDDGVTSKVAESPRPAHANGNGVKAPAPTKPKSLRTTGLAPTSREVGTGATRRPLSGKQPSARSR